MANKNEKHEQEQEKQVLTVAQTASKQMQALSIYSGALSVANLSTADTIDLLKVVDTIDGKNAFLRCALLYRLRKLGSYKYNGMDFKNLGAFAYSVLGIQNSTANSYAIAGEFVNDNGIGTLIDGDIQLKDGTTHSISIKSATYLYELLRIVITENDKKMSTFEKVEKVRKAMAERMLHGGESVQILKKEFEGDEGFNLKGARKATKATKESAPTESESTPTESESTPTESESTPTESESTPTESAQNDGKKAIHLTVEEYTLIFNVLLGENLSFNADFKGIFAELEKVLYK